MVVFWTRLEFAAATPSADGGANGIAPARISSIPADKNVAPARVTRRALRMHGLLTFERERID